MKYLYVWERALTCSRLVHSHNPSLGTTISLSVCLSNFARGLCTARRGLSCWVWAGCQIEESLIRRQRRQRRESERADFLLCGLFAWDDICQHQSSRRINLLGRRVQAQHAACNEWQLSNSNSKQQISLRCKVLLTWNLPPAFIYCRHKKKKNASVIWYGASSFSL